MSKYSYYTEEGLNKLKEELNDLKTRGRSDMAKQIAEARDKGDLSENAEYDAAKDAQGHLEHKISLMEAKVGNARILDESSIDPEKVALLSTVKIKNVANGMEMTYMLVPEEEADVKSGKISISSPIADALQNKKVGEIAVAQTPRGEMKFEVLSVSR